MSFVRSPWLRAAPAACAAALLGLAATTPAVAQPYDPDAYGDASMVGGVTVTAPHRERAWNGAEVDVLTASRTVDASDLDLSRRYGRRTLHARIVQAAVDACDELDNQWVSGWTPLDNDTDCIHAAVRRGMSDARQLYLSAAY